MLIGKPHKSRTGIAAFGVRYPTENMASNHFPSISLPFIHQSFQIEAIFKSRVLRNPYRNLNQKTGIHHKVGSQMVVGQKVG